MPPTTTTTTVSVTARTVAGVQHRLVLPGEREQGQGEGDAARVRVQVAALYSAVAARLSAAPAAAAATTTQPAPPSYAFSLVFKGAAVPPPVSTAGAAALARFSTAAASAAAAGSEPDEPRCASLADGDVLVIVPRRSLAPTDHARRAAAEASAFGGGGGGAVRRRGGGNINNDNVNDNDNNDDDDDDDDDELRHYRPPADAYAWEKRLGECLHANGAPALLLAWLFLARPWRVALTLLVASGARVAHAYGWGPPYVLLCLIAAMLLNLGRRREGEASAYSLFNAGVRRLPGQLDAAHMDAQIRAGGGL